MITLHLFLTVEKLTSDTAWILPLSLILASLIPMRMFITTFHELGHALVTSLYTREKIVVFLGSLGDTKNSRKITIGRFEFRIINNPLNWKGGLCTNPIKNISYRQHFNVIIAGPAASLLLVLILLAVIVVAKPSELYMAFFIIFFGFSLFAFLGSITGRRNGVNLANGQTILNDGQQLRMIMDRKKLPAEYKLAAEHYRGKNYSSALRLLEIVIAGGTKNAEVYRLAIACSMKTREYANADKLQKQQISLIGNINTNDRINMGLIKSHVESNEAAIAYYRHFLQTYGENRTVLNNVGYILTLDNRNEEAIPYLDRAIALDDKFAFAYNNRGYARLKTGSLEEGKADIDVSLKLDATNSYAWRNAGIYCFDMWRYEEALVNFEKAMELDPYTPMVDQYIFETRKKLGEKRKYST